SQTSQVGGAGNAAGSSSAGGSSVSSTRQEPPSAPRPTLGRLPSEPLQPASAAVSETASSEAEPRRERGPPGGPRKRARTSGTFGFNEKFNARSPEIFPVMTNC